MKAIHRTKVVGDLLLEWRTYFSLIWTSAFSIYKRTENDDWKQVLEINREQADDLQVVLRQAVLELEAAAENDSNEKGENDA